MELGRARQLLKLAMLCAYCAHLSGCKDEEVSTPEVHGSAEAIPVTGPDVPGIESFDAAIKPVLKNWNVFGATVAVAKDGRLIMARGYGYADAEARQPMQPDATLRIASVSKVITAIAILQLKDQGQLRLDDKVFEILSEYRVQSGGDQRLMDITVRDLLRHAGGWDASIAGDPLHQNTLNAGMFEISLRVTCRDLIQAAMSKPLQFTPGTQSKYSNFGFCVLGRVIEKITSMPYEIYVRELVLAPLGVQAMSIGYERESERGPYEPKYYAYDGERKVESVVPGEGLVSPPYGLHDLSSLDSTGGWIASAVDLMRVLTAVDGKRGHAISDESYAEMIADSQIPDDYGSAVHWEGLGVVVGPGPSVWTKTGALSGTRSFVVHDDRHGYSWVYLVNSNPEDSGGFHGAMSGAIQQGFGAHGSGGFSGSPADLFSQYPSPVLPARHR